MVERVRSINLHREDREPRLRSRHYIYRNIENPNPPPTEIEVLLIDNVDGKDLSLLKEIDKKKIMTFFMHIYNFKDNLLENLKKRGENVNINLVLLCCYSI